MEHEKDNVVPRKPRRRRALRAVGMAVLIGFVVLVGLPLTLYIPAVQDFVCRQVVSWLNQTDEALSFEVGYVRIGFPLQLRVSQVSATRRSTGQTLFSMGSLETGLDDIPWGQPYFVVNRVSITDVVLGMDSLTSSLGLMGAVDAIDISTIQVDPFQSELRVAGVVVKQPDLLVFLGPSQPDTTASAGNDWRIDIQQVSLEDGHLGLDMSDESLSDALGSVSLSRYLDPQHLSLASLNLHADNIHYAGSYVHAVLYELTAQEVNSGFGVEHLAVDFTMDGSHVAARDLDLKLSDGFVRGGAALDLTLLDSLHQGTAEVQLQAEIGSRSVVALAGGFVPTLPGRWPADATTLSLSARATGDSLDLRTLTLGIGRRVSLHAEASGTQLFNDAERVLAATVKGELADADFLLAALADTSAARPYRLPADLDLNVEASQVRERLSGLVSMQQQGRDVVWLEANLDTRDEGYHVAAMVDGLDVTAFVPDLAIDDVALRVQADGRHYAFPGRRTRLSANAQLDRLHFYDVTGRADSLMGVTAFAELQDGNYVADVQSQHPHVQIDTHLEGVFLADTVSTCGHIHVPRLDLARLPAGLSQPTLGVVTLRSQLAAAYNYGDNAALTMRIDSLCYDDGYTRNLFDSILVDFDARQAGISLDVSGGDAQLAFDADHPLSALPPVLDTLMAQTDAQLSALRFDFPAVRRCLPDFSLDFHIARNNPFYPALQYLGYGFRRVDVKAHNRQNLRLDAACELLQIDDLQLDTLEAHIRPTTGQEAYDIDLHANHLAPKARDSYDVRSLLRLLPDSLYADVCYTNGNYLTLYDGAASLAVGDDTLTFHLEKDPVLYAQPFTVNRDNFLGLSHYRNLDEHALNSRARIMLDGPRDMKVSLYSRRAPEGQLGQQLLLLLQQLDLNFIAQTIGWDGDTGGTLNMAAMAHLAPEHIAGQLRSHVGAFHLGEYRADSLAFDGRFGLAAHGTDVDGTLTIDSLVRVQLAAAMADSVVVRAGVNDLPLALVNFFMPADVALGGTTTGQVTLSGPDMERADFDAFLTLHDADVSITDLDAHLHLPSDTLRLHNKQLRFNNYNITAANRNPISINGLVDMRRDLANPDIDLHITGENVRIIDSKRLRLRNQYIYGRLPIGTDIRVRGNASNLRVDGSLRVMSGTNLFYYLQDDPLQSTSRVDELVEFVSFRQVDRSIASGSFKPRAPMVAASDEGTTVGLKVNIDKDVRVTAYLPGTDNNYAAIVGGGALDVQCAPNGSLTMGGVYDVTSGQLNYKLPVLPMAKLFDISNVSHISWDGPVDNPNIHIVASEDVKATVNDDAGSRIVRFLVNIAISGTLEALDLTFSCDAPDDGSISSEIATLTPEENSKAALMLLIAQTYTGPGSSSSMGLSTANAAINSMLNRQMDAMLGSSLKHTNIDLGIDTYSTEAGASRTDYSIKVSQNFFNDRFRATIGGKVSSGAEMSQQNGAQLGDMSLEWLIKKDGSHYLRLYRHTNYESVLEGQVIETGIGYVQERSAYRFRHLLVPTSQKRQARMQEIIRQLQEREAQEQRSQLQPTTNDESESSVHEKE